MAFALDAWWDNAQSRGELRQDISNIRQEISDNRQELAFQLDLLQRHMAGVNELLNLMGGSEAASLAVSDTLAWLSTITPSFNPALGAIDALIAGGRLGAIADPDVRRRLAAIQGRVEDAVEEQIESRELFDNLLAPVLFRRLDMETLKSVGGRLVRIRMPGIPLESEGNTVDFPNDLFIRNALDRRRFLYSISANELGDLEVQFDSLLVTLEES